MAFQRTVDMRDNSIFAYEALVRGCDGSGAATIFGKVNQQNRYAFGQECRVHDLINQGNLTLSSIITLTYESTCFTMPSAAEKEDG